MGDEPQGTRKFPNDAALLSGPPRSPLFAEAEENRQRTAHVNALHSKIQMRRAMNKKNKQTQEQGHREQLDPPDLPQWVAHHAGVLGLQGDEVAEGRQCRGLMRRHWRTRVQEEMLAGDQRRKGLVRHG